MLVKNIDQKSALVNGARGMVVQFTEHNMPVVCFANGQRRVIYTETWTLKSNGGAQSVTRKQIPLKLAWAISIHKSQGLTIDHVAMNLSKVRLY